MRPTKISLVLPIFIACALVASKSVLAQPVPLSYVASTDIYKVISENEQYRVIAVTWKPGQRDNWHSHGVAVASYNLTDCNLRFHTPDGKSVDRNTKTGDSRVQPQAPSHSVENVGQADCKLVLFEPK